MTTKVSFDALGRRFESCRGHQPQVTTHADHRESNHDTRIHHKPITYAPARRNAFRLSRAVAIAGEIVLAVMAAVAYGTLGAIVEVALDTARYVNAADHWRNGLVVFGVLLLVAWGRSAHRRWFAVTQESGRWGQ